MNEYSEELSPGISDAMQFLSSAVSAVGIIHD